MENRFLWDTKTDVVKRIVDAECEQLIGLSRSCGQTIALESRTHTHCGVCSQCLDRRFAVLAAGQEANDPARNYAVDLLVGDRGDGDPKAQLGGYLELADQVSEMGESDFLTHFGELARALPHLNLPLGVASARVFALYKKDYDDIAGHDGDACGRGATTHIADSPQMPKTGAPTSPEPRAVGPVGTRGSRTRRGEIRHPERTEPVPRQDYIPDPDSDFIAWFQNYKTQVAAVATTFGLTPAEVTTVDADFTAMQGKLNTLTAKKAEQQAATVDKRTARRAIEGRARALANRLKAHPSFTPALGEQLGIIGPEDTTDLTTAKPTLVARRWHRVR